VAMPDYKALYFKLFAAAADAVDALDQNQSQQARQILLRAQLEAEDLWISDQPKKCRQMQ